MEMGDSKNSCVISRFYSNRENIMLAKYTFYSSLPQLHSGYIWPSTRS